jgi:16S rRNA (guanine1516-N2)-methyltransferase
MSCVSQLINIDHATDEEVAVTFDAIFFKGQAAYAGYDGEPYMTRAPEELRVDFVGGAVAHRLRFGGGRGQALAKAMGLRAGKTPSIVDATAGLGRDSFLLASLGAQVTMIERSPKMHALLVQGMQEAYDQGGALREIITRMTLLHGDAKDLLPQLAAEAVLIDPMHPPRKNSALVKLELRQVREIVGTDDDAVDLVRVALDHASNRVVLKWPSKADPIQGLQAPSHQIAGKTTRYDVFMKS